MGSVILHTFTDSNTVRFIFLSEWPPTESYRTKHCTFHFSIMLQMVPFQWLMEMHLMKPEELILATGYLYLLFTVLSCPLWRVIQTCPPTLKTRSHYKFLWMHTILLSVRTSVPLIYFIFFIYFLISSDVHLIFKVSKIPI